MELLVVVAIMAVVAGMLLTTMRAVWKVVRGWQATGNPDPIAIVHRV